VRTRSATQLLQGLYGDAIRHSRHYDRALGSVEAVLAPWVETYGYGAAKRPEGRPLVTEAD
jgi:hypothetical protein